MNTKGLALVTVMGFILILSLLMVPLALGITQMTSSANVVASKIGTEEARNSAVELVRYSIATSTACKTNITSDPKALAQGSLISTISCSSTVSAFNGDAYQYWGFHVTYTPKNAVGKSVSFTGSAVEYMVIPSVVYIVHVEDNDK